LEIKGITSFKSCLNYRYHLDTIQKRRIKSLFLPFQCKHAFKNFCPRGLPPSICSQIQKYLKLIREEGSAAFFKKSKIPKILNHQRGGGLIEIFFSEASPYDSGGKRNSCSIQARASYQTRDGHNYVDKL